MSSIEIDPFATDVRGLDDPAPAQGALRAAGPLVRVRAPAGGPLWVVTDEALAKEVFTHPDIVKDPAFAPVSWDRQQLGLEPTAAEQTSLTTLDGPPHAELRRAHAPLLSARRIQERAGQVRGIATDLLRTLADGVDRGTPVGLTTDFTIRFPLTVVLDLVGVPLEHLDAAADGCRLILANDHRGIGELARIAATALDTPGGLAAELRGRLPEGAPHSDLHYHLFGLIFAGQITTDAALGFLLARVLGDAAAGSPIDAGDDAAVAEVVRETLRVHPPAPFGLWRFTAAPVELAGQRLPARAPVLVDIRGVNARSGSDGDLTFGGGPHYCIGAQLAQLELRTAVVALRTHFPDARLAVPFADLRQLDEHGALGSRVTSLPVVLRP